MAKTYGNVLPLPRDENRETTLLLGSHKKFKLLSERIKFSVHFKDWAAPGPPPGFEVWGTKYIEGDKICFYYMFKTTFSGYKIGRAQKNLVGHCPRMPP